MEINFLKISPKEAAEVLRICILAGYELRNSLMDDYHIAPQNGEKLDSWNSRRNVWRDETVAKLKEIYSSPVEPLVFENYRAVSCSIGISHDFGEVIISIEGKLLKLYELYQFIFNHSNIVINAGGDIIFQHGDNNQANQND